MSKEVDQTFATPEGKFLVDPYENWARAEAVPIHTGATLDLMQVATRPWPRFGVAGAICELDARDDYLSLHVFEIAPGAAMTPQRHLHDVVYYALSGAGDMDIEHPGKGKTKVPWGPTNLFAAPMNATHSLRNTGPVPGRVLAISDFRYLIQLYRNEKFLFDTPIDFPERATGDYVRDCARVDAGSEMRPNERILPIALAGGSIGVDLIEIAPGQYTRAERQMFGSLMLGVSGKGMTVSWEEGEEARSITRWRHGIAFAPAGLRFHQHFNIGPSPLRFLRVEWGSVTAPMFRPRRRNYGDTEVYASGAATIEGIDAATDKVRRAAMTP